MLRGVVIAVIAGRLAAAWAAPRTAPHPTDETSVFSGAEEAAPGSRQRPPVVSYWRVRTEITVGERSTPVGVRLLVPASDGRQEILSRQTAAPGFHLTETVQGTNLRAEWTAERTGPATIVYEVLARVSAVNRALPDSALASIPPCPDPTALRPTPEIQSDAPEVVRRARTLTAGADRLDAVVWALFQTVAAFRPAAIPAGSQDAARVLTAHAGTSLGRARALVALLRASGVAARTVGGLRLTNDTTRRATSSWVEIWDGSDWVPFDPSNGYYAGLPESYLALYDGDLPLIVHTAGLPLDYQFTMRETTRRAVEDDLLPPAGAPQTDADAVAARSTFVRTPVASVLLVTDRSVPEAVTDRILREAREAAIDCVLVTAPFESRFFRETHLERLLAAEERTARRAHLILVATGDDAGPFALLSLANRGVRLPDTRVLLAGTMPSATAHLLGTLAYRMLHPGELLLLPHATDLLPLWEIARANLLDGTPLRAEADRWGFDALVLGDPGVVGPSWRPRLVRLLERAIGAQVPLATLRLILAIPLIATLVVTARIVIGWQAFGTFGPVIISLVFVTMGLRWGTVVFVTIVGVGILLRAGLQRLRLQAVARLAILVTLVAALMAALTLVGATLGIGSLLHVSVFPMIIVANVIESFASAQTELGTRYAVRTTLGTLGLAMACYLVVERTVLPSLMLAMPELVLVTIAANVALGRWRGIRLLEYVRFWRAFSDELPSTRPPG